jgi:pimeloyl-ACP methyl ester carboxylesterase
MEESAGGKLWSMRGGSGSPTLVLLHGLGANAAVWEPLLPIVAERWPGKWLAPDLRGHGRSPHDAPYGYATYAADVASLLDQNEDAVLVAHSMGGVVAMALATGWFGIHVQRVVAFGVKIAWTAEEVGKLRDIAHAPIRWFDRREEAVERFLRVSGLKGLAAADSAVAEAGIAERRGQFRLAMDPRANAVVGPPVEDFIGAMRAPLRLLAGSKDPMVTGEQVRRFDKGALVLDGLGHNLHAEAPARLWEVVEASLSGQ